MILWQLWSMFKLFPTILNIEFVTPRNKDKRNSINGYGHPRVQGSYCKQCPDLPTGSASFDVSAVLISNIRPLGLGVPESSNYKTDLYHTFLWHRRLKNHIQCLAKIQQYSVEGVSNISKAAIHLSSLLFPSTEDGALICIFVHLHLALFIVLALTSFLAGLLGMGNEESVPSSENSTPISENPSLYSIHSRVRSSIESTRAPSPMEAPEPDLSHLSPEEIAQIRGVMERARNMQQEESSRARKLQEEYIELATKIEREASLTELSEAGVPLCPICSKAEVTQDSSRPDMNVCIDCQKVTCVECGAYITPLTSKTPEWVCSMCDKRRRLVMTTGLWYHGCHPESELPLERQITGVTTDWSRESDSLMVSSMDTSSISRASSLGSRESYESSDPMTESSSWAGSRCGGDSSHSLDLGSLTRASSQNSELAKQVFEQSRMKGILLYMMGPCGPGATLPKSESDEFSDLASDLDFDELATECCKLEGVSSADESTRDTKTASVSSKTENRQQSHKPTLLIWPQGHPAIASGEKGDYDSNNTQTDSLGVQKNNGSRTNSSLPDAQSYTESSDSLMTFTNQQSVGYQTTEFEFTTKMVSQQDLDILVGKGSIFPGDPNLQESMEFFIIPSCLSDSQTDEMYGSNGSKDSADDLESFKVTCPSYRHSSIADNSLDVNAFEHSVTEGKCCSNSASLFESTDFHPTGTMTHSAPVMDFSSLAANTMTDSQSLTSMKIVHSNALSHASNYIMEEPLSSESEEDIDSDSTLSISQTCNDCSTSTTDDLNEIEQVDSTVKPADFQSMKRQKIRPPAMDWSPVIDLSPIQDVSPSIEEAEQEDMLAKQLEELQRQRYLTAEVTDFDNGDSERLQNNNYTDFKSADLTDMFPPRLLQHISSCTTKLHLELIEDVDEKDKNEADLIDDNSPFIGTLKRCNNCEDISKLGSDSSFVDQPCDVDSECQLQDDNFISNISYYSCTTQSHMLPHSTKHISTNISALPAESKNLQEAMEYEQGTKQLKDLENFITGEIHKITEDMENIVKQGYVEVKSMPPPKPKRKLPDPELTVSPSEFVSEGEENTLSARIKTDELSEMMECRIRNSTSEMPAEKCLRRQDSTEKKKAKDMKAKPSPLLVQHIESEEQVVSPHYKVMESPPTPENRTIKREFSMGRSVSPNSSSRSVSPKSSPDLDAYTYLSPITSPDSDSSPPQPHSPSLFRIDSSDRDSKLPFCDINSRNYRMSLCIDSGPYSNVAYSRLPSTTDPANESFHVVNFSLKNGNHGKVTSDIVVKPPISPRKSIQKFEGQTSSCARYPLYENVKEFFALELLQTEKDKTSLFGKDSEKCISFEDVLQLDKQSQEISHRAEIFTYPVIAEFSGRSRSNSAPSMDVQQLAQSNRCLEPLLHQQRASVNHAHGSLVDRTEGVRTKIQEFEESPAAARNQVCLRQR
ncbi:hypothetical protein BsWGS_13979 [Bradybaena similaris]